MRNILNKLIQIGWIVFVAGCVAGMVYAYISAILGGVSQGFSLSTSITIVTTMEVVVWGGLIIWWRRILGE